MNIYKKRIDKVQEEMRRTGVEYLILGPSSNMFYFAGLKAHVDERLQLLLIPAQGLPSAILPQMYKEKAQDVFGGSFPLFTWSDQQDPLELVKKAIPEVKSCQIAVDDTLWSSHLIALMEIFRDCNFNPASRVVDSLRQFKGDEEILYLAKAGEFADQVMELVREEIRPGMSEKELAHFIETSYKQLADDISFKPIVASGPNGASPHHSTGERKFKHGDFIVVDCGGLHKGYCSDITRTFCLGGADDEMKKVYKAVHAANESAFAAVVRGCSGEEADDAAREVITQAGYGPNFTHRTGHGIGLDVHEAPNLVAGNREKLLPGMVFSIEPGIYLAGRFGVRIEDIVAVTDKGPRRLNQFTRDLIEL